MRCLVRFCLLVWLFALWFYQPIVKEIQERRATVTDEVLKQFMSVRPLEF